MKSNNIPELNPKNMLAYELLTPLPERYKVCIDPEATIPSLSSDSYLRNFQYQELLCSLLFVEVCTKLTIAFAIGYLARFTKNFNHSACEASCVYYNLHIIRDMIT